MTDIERLERCDYMNFGPKGTMTDILIWHYPHARTHKWIAIRRELGKGQRKQQCHTPEEVLAIVDKWLEEVPE